MDLNTRFILDNILDATREGALVAWPAFDVREKREVWLIGRRVKDQVLPIAVLLASAEVTQRYAPAKAPGEYDFSQVLK